MLSPCLRRSRPLLLALLVSCDGPAPEKALPEPPKPAPTQNEAVLAEALATGEKQRLRLSNDLASEEVASARRSYRDSLRKLEDTRRKWQDEWPQASAERRTAILDEAEAALVTALSTVVFPAWEGTEWNFHGTTTVPGEGTIACGYFVTTCLRDLGFQVERVRLAQQASQTILKTVARRGDSKLIHARPLSDFVDWVKQAGPGIYLVGLDRHTGFVVNEGGRLAFVHSSYYRPPFSVVSEPVEGRNPLADSRYRIVGRLFAPQALRRWVAGEAFPMGGMWDQD